ncbi:MAG TPA: hypothetical protein PK048_00050 [Candidatus Absconditabacterales bacterium]|nr:hypothetical protein [Candidatus Absconditabacterales bacterium]
MSKYQSPWKLLGWRCAKVVRTFSVFVQNNWLQSIITLGVLIVVIVMMRGVIMIIRSDRFVLRQIIVDMDTNAQHYPSKLSYYLESDFQGMNRVSSWYYRWKFEQYYKKTHPWIQDIVFDVQDNTMTIKVMGHQSVLILEWDGGLFTFVGDEHYVVPYSGNQTTSGTMIPLVHIVSWPTQTTGLDTMMYLLTPESFIRQIQLLTDNLSGYQAIFYIPGSSKVHVDFGRLDVYFDINKNMIEQLYKYRLIIGTGNILGTYTRIDIGTMDREVYLGN